MLDSRKRVPMSYRYHQFDCSKRPVTNRQRRIIDSCTLGQGKGSAVVSFHRLSKSLLKMKWLISLQRSLKLIRRKDNSQQNTHQHHIFQTQPRENYQWPNLSPITSWQIHSNRSIFLSSHSKGKKLRRIKCSKMTYMMNPNKSPVRLWEYLPTHRQRMSL